MIDSSRRDIELLSEGAEVYLMPNPKWKSIFWNKVCGMRPTAEDLLLPLFWQSFSWDTRRMLDKCKDSPIFYDSHYVDDTFCVFKTEHDALKFCNTPTLVSQWKRN